MPIEWYNRYRVDNSVPVRLPYDYKYIETEQLSIKAHELKESRKYYEAINLYEEALRSEPRNPMILFDLAETYARINNLEQAVILLDTAIMVDSTYSGFYNNRGLLFYKLNENGRAIKDYLKAIEIDSTKTTFYYNIALVYYYEDDFIKACESINKAEQLGLNLSNYKGLKRIKRKHCK
jgi:tetratricopeptide (TPR) repeat protein